MWTAANGERPFSRQSGESKILSMKRRLWQIAFALLVAFGTAQSALAAQTLSIEKMEELLTSLRGKSDGKVAGELNGVHPTERVSASRLARWEAEFPGSRTREELMKLADMSAFLEPPAPDVLENARPDVKTQLGILKLAVQYVANTMPRLPDFYATRVTTHFDNQIQQSSFSVGSLSEELHPAGSYTRTVTYRDGREVAYEGAGKQKQEPALALTTTGEFGPILIVVVEDALHGKVAWSRWEQGAGGPIAVFAYAVPQTESHFMVGLARTGAGQGIFPAYHGEIAIDSVTGAILRLVEIADLTPTRPGMLASISLEYGPVTISGRSYICPVKGVAFSEYPLNDPSAANKSTAAFGLVGKEINENSDKDLSSENTELNDVAFTNYHEFGSEARIVTSPDASADGGAGGAGGIAAPEMNNGGTAPSASSAANAPTNPSPMPNAATAAGNSAAGSSAAAPVAPASSTAAKPGTDAEAAAPTARAGVALDIPATGTVLHAESQLVLVDVVVTDHDKPVTGLDRSRFHVFQDGREQDIASFDETEPDASGPTDASAALVRPPALPPDTFSNQPVYRKANAVNVLLLDGLNTEAADQLYVRREMVSYLKTLPPGMEIAIFTLGSKLRLVQGFTEDTGKLLAALANKKAAAPASLRQSAEQKTEDQAEIDRMTDAEVSPMDIANTQDFLSESEEKQTGMRVQFTLEAFQEMGHYLSGIPGRKNLIWFSGSFPLQFFAMGSSPIEQMKLNADGALGEQVRETADLLAAERVAVYPVDARGVLGQSMFDASLQAQDYTRPAAASPIGGGPSRFSQDTQLGALQTGAEHASMDVVAQETGGRAVHDSNGLKEALADALSDGSNFYSVAYVPPERKDGQSGAVFHTIEVKVDGAKYQLAYRRGYYTDDTSRPTENTGKVPEAMTQAAVLGAPPSTQIVFQAQVLPESATETNGAAPIDNVAGEKTTSFPGGARRCKVDLSVPLQNLTFAEGTGGAGRAQFESALVAYNDEGLIVNTVGRAFHFDLQAGEYQRLIAAGGAVLAHLALDLPASGVTLRIVVYDPASAKTGSLEVPVEGAGKQASTR